MAGKKIYNQKDYFASYSLILAISGGTMSLSGQIYDLGMLEEGPESSQPLDLKKSLRIRDGIELSRPKSAKVHILQPLRTKFDWLPGICCN